MSNPAATLKPVQLMSPSFATGVFDESNGVTRICGLRLELVYVDLELWCMCARSREKERTDDRLPYETRYVTSVPFDIAFGIKDLAIDDCAASDSVVIVDRGDTALDTFGTAFVYMMIT